VLASVYKALILEIQCLKPVIYWSSCFIPFLALIAHFPFSSPFHCEVTVWKPHKSLDSRRKSHLILLAPTHDWIYKQFTAATHEHKITPAFSHVNNNSSKRTFTIYTTTLCRPSYIRPQGIRWPRRCCPWRVSLNIRAHEKKYRAARPRHCMSSTPPQWR